MPVLGVDPKSLSSIGMMLGSDATKKLAYTCADSKEWQEAIRHYSKEKENYEYMKHLYGLLVKILNESAIYEPYNEAFKRYEIESHVTAVEKVSFPRFSTFEPRNSSDRAKGKLPVPGFAVVTMRFRRLN
jgi:hypothetical protein